MAAGSTNTKAAATSSSGSGCGATEAEAAASNSAREGAELAGTTATNADPAKEEVDLDAIAVPSSGPKPPLAAAASSDPATANAAMASGCKPGSGNDSDEAALDPDVPDAEEDDAELPRAAIWVSPTCRLTGPTKTGGGPMPPQLAE